MFEDRSIEILAYNMEKYLGRCLDSLLIEDKPLLAHSEILIINDGSTDRSLEIAREYENRFPDIIRVIDKANGNYGSCLNIAFQEAKGVYFRTLDADDWFDTNAFSLYIKKLMDLESKVDLILTTFSVERRGKSQKYKPNGNEGEIYSFSDFNSSQLKYCIQSATYLTSIVKNIKLQEHICYTDIEVCLYTLQFIHTFIFFDICLYKYWVGRSGQSVSINSYRKNVKHMYRIIIRWLRQCHEHNLSNSYQYAQNQVLLSFLGFYYFICLIHPISNLDKKDFLEVDRFILSKHPILYDAVLRKKFYHMPFVYCWKKMPSWMFALFSWCMRFAYLLMGKLKKEPRS